MLIDSQHQLEVLNSEIAGFSGHLYRASLLKEDEILAPYATAHFSGVLEGTTPNLQTAFNRKRQKFLDKKLDAQIDYTGALNLALRLISQTSTYSGQHETLLTRLKKRFKSEADSASSKAFACEFIRWQGTKRYNARMRTLEARLTEAQNIELMRLPGTLQAGAFITVENSLFIQMENVLDSKMHIATMNKLEAEQNAGFVAACTFVQQPLTGKQREDRLYAAGECERYTREDIIGTARLLADVRAYALIGRNGCYLN